jgi:toxin FitB
MPTAPELPVRLFDTSAAVPLLVQDHEFHLAVLAIATESRRGLAGHAWFETYSVLTRLPAGQRQSPAAVHTALTRTFPQTRFLAPEATVRLALEIAERGIAGGAVFDALVATVARSEDVELVTCDRRARTLYEALGVRVVWPAGIA